jgi:predicted acyltransferase
MSVLNTANKRIASLDQFRGYTVAGMFLVNFLSPFVAAPFVLKHHSS